MRRLFSAAKALDRTVSRSRSPVPVHALDVAIHADRQHTTAAGATALEDLLATLGPHSRAEPVNAHATANFWLIGTLSHLILSKKTGHIALYLALTD